VAELLVFAAGFLAVFLFCAAKADVPASASAKAALIRIRFIILLRWIFVDDRLDKQLGANPVGPVDFWNSKGRAGSYRRTAVHVSSQINQLSVIGCNFVISAASLFLWLFCLIKQNSHKPEDTRMED
jgi:hypothetical protein